jgi:hypothetical protein
MCGHYCTVNGPFTLSLSLALSLPLSRSLSDGRILMIAKRSWLEQKNEHCSDPADIKVTGPRITLQAGGTINGHKAIICRKAFLRGGGYRRSSLDFYSLGARRCDGQLENVPQNIFISAAEWR